MSGRAESKNIIPGRCAVSVGRADMPTPKGWKWSKLGDVARLESGHTPSRKHPEYWDGGIPWIGIKDARAHHGRTIHTTFQTVTQEGLDNSAARLLPPGTICLSRTASVGYTFVLGEEMATSQDFVNWVCSDEVVPEYLMYAFMAEGDRLRSFGQGTTHTTIYYPEVKALHVCHPPADEQRRIVARIEELFSRLDAGVAALRHAKAQLQRYRQSVLAAAVTGQLTQAWREQNPDTEPASELLNRTLEQRREQWSGKRKYREPKEPAVKSLSPIPSSWTWISPDQLSAPEDYSLAIGPFGSNLKVADYTDEGVPLVFVRHIRANNYDLTQKFVSEEKAAELIAHSVDPGDLLVTKMGEPPGDAALYPLSRPHAIITADCIKLRLPEGIDSRLFFVNAINSKVVANQITPRTRGVAQKKISLDRFRDVALPLPPLAEQHQIVAELEARTTAIDHLDAELDRQIIRSNRLRQSTLTFAFSGRI